MTKFNWERERKSDKVRDQQSTPRASSKTPSRGKRSSGGDRSSGSRGGRRNQSSGTDPLAPLGDALLEVGRELLQPILGPVLTPLAEAWENLKCSRLIREREKFLVDVEKMEGVKGLPGYCQLDHRSMVFEGVHYKVITAGTGEPAKSGFYSGDIHYKGMLLDGTEFLNSYKHGYATHVEYNASWIYPPLRDALPLMTKGATWQVFIPFGHRERLARTFSSDYDKVKRILRRNHTVVLQVEVVKWWESK